MFTRKVPYDQERETLQYLPYLRVLPFQLARRVIHMLPLDEGAALLLHRECEEYDLIWNEESAENLKSYIAHNLSAYRESISKFKGTSLSLFPVYQHTDGQQFRFIQSELQCGHIFLRIWVDKGNKQR